MEHLYTLSAGLSCFFIAILWSKPHKKQHDRILISWLSLILIQVLVSYWEVKHPYTFLLEISSGLVYVHGPLLYFYILALTSPDFAIKGRILLHLLPSVLYLQLVMPFVLDGKLAPLPEFWRIFLAYTKLASILIYSMLVLKIRRQHLLQAENTLSTLDTIQLTWIKHVIYGVLLVWATGLFSQVIVGWGWVPRVHEDIVVNISVSVLVIVLGYYGIRQTPIFIDLPVAFEKGPELLTPVPMITEEQTASSKYQRSGLDADKSQFYADRLASFMEQNKPYTDPELSLGSLAAQLSLSPNHLSQIINEQFGKNFWDFVNEYRIKQVIACLQAGAHKKHTLLGIALDAGFNSKVSFNRAFKKFTSETPSGYLKKL